MRTKSTKVVNFVDPAFYTAAIIGLLAWGVIASNHITWRRAVEGSIPAVEVRNQDRWFAWTSVAWLGVVGLLCVLHVRMTRRRHGSERSLRSALARLGELESIINRGPAVVFLWRVDEGWPVEFVSDNVKQFGYSAEDLTSGRMSWPGITHPEDVPRLEAELVRYREQGIREFTQQYRLITARGDVRWIEDRTIALPAPDGSVSYYQGIILDVTEQRLAEEALRREKEFAENLIETAPAMVGVLDAHGRVVRCNPYCEQVTGYRLRELEGRDAIALLIPAEERPNVRRLFAEIVAGKDNVSTATEIVPRDGGRREIEWNSRLLRNSAGEVVGVLALGRDVTELKQAQLRALQAERLAAIGQMVTGLAHESGNALQRSQACLEMLALEVGNQPAAVDLVHRIQSAQGRLQKLYEDVRQYAAPVVLRRQVCFLPDLIGEAWAELEPLWKERNVRLEAPPKRLPDSCLVDPYAIERVFRNILQNSLAACTDPVQIHIHWEDAVLQERPAVRVRLCDNGPGLSAEQRKKVFEPFYTTKTQGTGLGLAISKRIVEAHGGRIAVGDCQESGAELIVTLPKE